MKICIVGAGAIGEYLRAKLALSGEEVTLIARGAHLNAIQTNGLKLITDTTTNVCNVAAQNGVPWWYFRKCGTKYEEANITSVDPDGTLEANIGVERTIGCVVYPADILLREN